MYLLWLAVDGFWYAIHAPDFLDGSVLAILQVGHPIFRTRGNAVSAGSHIWELNHSLPGKTADWQPLGAFTTEVPRSRFQGPVYGQNREAGMAACAERQLASGGVPGTLAMVSFAEGAMPPFANPLVRQICVGSKERGYIYSRVDDVGLLWTCARPSFVGEQRGGAI